MPRVPIIMPQLGESIAEATVVHLPFAVGDKVEGDTDLLEVETNKATMGVTAPCSGRIAEWHVKVQESYPVGATLGWLEVSQEDATRLGVDAEPPPSATKPGSAPLASPEKHAPSVEPTVRGLPVPAHGRARAIFRPA